MTDQEEGATFHTRTHYRVVAGCFGVFLAGVGVYVLFSGGTSPVLRWISGLALLLLGGDLAYSAFTAKASWLSKVGPLP